ncbi:sensor histidine kinase [Streptomyces sp. NBC_00053]|uniref:sensor histidine kinase n=1 Tax=unclassified Streptomyces TaxID=2593676 RepID=UPI000F5B9E3F|nr:MULTISPECIES: sensor histidine kinase [unclassified Streptomyces]WSG53154.1 sensor histidine kinase [Streptomyces sp. NBC_01732]WSX03806.1 sensor histidine kinase [Streptomyces sp. NBC_00987]MCX4394162.1 sensor histidine kinase [Streptomyces sp. NBC_01767]MCX5106111.1 sensor histidine kinase [Streptomyces sp. NBC_00439]MCX5502960.1 sensor histidine kinase [Streptomyces sp. NBC_00052]
MNDDVTSVGLGSPPTNRKQFWIKLLWIGIWLAFMSAPVKDLADGNHTPWATALGTLGLLTFVGAYLLLVFRHTTKPLDRRLLHSAIAFLGLLSVVLTLTLGTPWLVLFVYVAVSVGATLPLRTSRWLIPVVTAVLVGIGLTGDHPREVITALVFPALLGGFSMTGVRQLIRTTIELREARATVAQLAANEERLRLARDLHDLLGHSLSLITLKSELAGRMLPDHPEQAAAQVADIEQVSRQALIDVRGAVTGYRRPTLPGELAGARTALAAAGITADVPAEAPDDVPEKPEEVLAWALREAVTNVVRHSGARHCTVTLAPRQTLDGRLLELTVSDDGVGPSGTKPGNGLTGIGERLATVDGTLRTSAGNSGSGKGFTLTLSVPLESGLGSTE